jgi:hypothetical protein
MGMVFIYHLKSMQIKNTMTYDVGNPGPGLRQEQQCGGVKLVNVYDTQPFVAISNKMIVNKIMLLMFKIFLFNL